jgi:hypothetical protein
LARRIKKDEAQVCKQVKFIKLSDDEQGSDM